MKAIDQLIHNLFCAYPSWDKKSIEEWQKYRVSGFVSFAISLKEVWFILFAALFSGTVSHALVENAFSYYYLLVTTAITPLILLCYCLAKWVCTQRSYSVHVSTTH